MQIAFHGAARTVTGSKHLITTDKGLKILLDCGLFQGLGKQTDGLNEAFGFEPSQVDFLVLSHAHIDHCGLIPRLVAQGFKGTIVGTPATMDLARILLLDSAKIQAQDAAFENKHLKPGQAPELPLYLEEDVHAALRLFKVVAYEEYYKLSPEVGLWFTDAGHILGSCAVHLAIEEQGEKKRLTFSGDVGRYEDLLLNSPQHFKQAKYIILESTYGDRLHQKAEPIEMLLHEVIAHTVNEKRGKVIIPAFSVGRTQELLYALNALELKGLLPKVPYYVDSPLSLLATQVIKSHPEVYNQGVKRVMRVDQDPFAFEGLQFIESVEASKALNDDPRPCVIISSSGMAEAGRVKHHIKNNISNSKNTILMVGYAEPNSLGGKLLAGRNEVFIFGQNYQVKAEVRSIRSMSAHGDYKDLLKFLSCQDPALVEKLFLVHGELPVQEVFKSTLQQHGFKQVEIPAAHQVFEL